jgi:outer membrane protein OmpA-like peptidoglycan-associated protein
MAFNFIDAIQDQLKPDVVQDLGKSVGADTVSTGKALTAAIPAVATGFVNQGSSEGGAGRLLSMLGDHGMGQFSSARELLHGGVSADMAQRGQGLMGSLFGDKSGGVTDMIGKFAGIGGGSSSKLMALVAPIALGVLGKHARDNNLDAGGLSRLLGGQRDLISRAMPSGLSGLTGLLGMGGAAAALHAAPARTREAYEERTRVRGDDRLAREPYAEPHMEKRSPWRALLPIGLGLLALIAIWSLVRGRGERHYVAPEYQGRTATAPAPRANVPAPRTTGERPMLPGGRTLNAAPGSGTYELAQTLGQQGDVQLPKSFSMNELHFASGSAQLDSAGNQQVRSLASVLQAYPSAKIRVQGGADTTGDAAENQKLSEARADAVRQGLMANGVPGDQVEAQGMGTQTAQQGGEEANARRTDVILLSK